MKFHVAGSLRCSHGITISSSEQKAAQEELPKKLVGINKEESDLSQQTFKVKRLVSLVVVVCPLDQLKENYVLFSSIKKLCDWQVQA